jgi:acyl-CoA thioester hydrolase
MRKKASTFTEDVHHSSFILAELSMLQGEISIRVRYAETDRMGLLHHANYLVYFEQGRTELLRSCGLTYKELEDQGFLLVLTKIEVRYRSPARYDDLLTLKTRVVRTTAVRIDHAYEVFRESTLLAEGSSTLACVDRDGKLQELPPFLRMEKEE